MKLKERIVMAFLGFLMAVFLLLVLDLNLILPHHHIHQTNQDYVHARVVYTKG